MASDIQNKSTTIQDIIMEITQGISRVGSNAVETAEKSQYIRKNVDDVTNQVGTIVKAIKDQTTIAEELKGIINVYKI